MTFYMDRRSVIIREECHVYGVDDSAMVESSVSEVKSAMDTYMKECVLEAFEFVAKKTTGKQIDESGKVEFKYNGEWITPEKLFENFL